MGYGDPLGLVLIWLGYKTEIITLVSLVALFIIVITILTIREQRKIKNLDEIMSQINGCEEDKDKTEKT